MNQPTPTMKKIYSRLQELNRRIADCDSETQAVKRLPFYSLFKQEAQREKDLSQLRSLKQDLLSQKMEVLEAMATEVKREKAALLKIS